MTPSNFIAMCTSGEAMPDDIDEFVGRWHEGDGKVPIYEYLGMTRDEYFAWVSDPYVLFDIVRALDLEPSCTFPARGNESS